MNERAEMVTLSLEEYTSLLECRLKLNALVRWHRSHQYGMSNEEFEMITGFKANGTKEGEV